MDIGFAHSAQGVLMNAGVQAACGSACGSGDKGSKLKPAACGSACSSGDKGSKMNASACGSACGSGDKK